MNNIRILNKNLKLKKLLLLFSLLFAFLNPPLKSEGTKQLRPEYRPPNKAAGFLKIHGKMASFNSDSIYRLYIRIGDTTETIYLGFGQAKQGNIRTANEYIPKSGKLATNLHFRIKDPDGNVVYYDTVPTSGKGYIGRNLTAHYEKCVAGPKQINGPDGYDALSFNPSKTGDYYIEFKDFDESTTFVMFQLFDITVAKNNKEIPGRLWSHFWTLSSPGRGGSLSQIDPYEGKLYTYSMDNIVTEIAFKDFEPYGFDIYCNSKGTDTTKTVEENRRSIKGSALIYPQHKIFLQPPDSNEFPTGTLSCVKAITTINQCNSNNYCLDLEATENGFANVFVDLNNNGKYDFFSADVIFNAVEVKKGEVNCIYWDGKDNYGNPVPYNDSLKIYASMIAGITHLPVYDVEGCGGIKTKLIRPSKDCHGNPLDNTVLFWDDSNVYGTVNVDDGCSGYCHTWKNKNEITHNSWWYIVNEQTKTSFVPRDTVVMITFDSLNNQNGYYYDGDSTAINIFYRNDLYNKEKIINGMDITSDNKPHYGFSIIGTDTSDVNSYTSKLKVFLRVNIADTGMIDRLGFTVDVQTNYCLMSKHFLREGIVDGKYHTQNLSCYKSDDGLITIYDGIGGSGTYQYSIDGGNTWQNNNTFTNLKAGSYDIRIRDKNNNNNLSILNNNHIITQPARVISKVSIDGITSFDKASVCSEGMVIVTGKISKNESSYKWLDQQGNHIGDSSELVIQSSGEYTLIASDYAGCSDTNTFEVTINPFPDIQFSDTNDYHVYFNEERYYAVEAEPNHSYTWQLPDYGTITDDGRGDGVHIKWGDIETDQATIYVSDSNTTTGCTANDSIKIKVSELHTLTIETVIVDRPESCKGTNDASLTAIIDGGNDNIEAELIRNDTIYQGEINRGIPNYFRATGLPSGEIIIHASNDNLVPDVYDTITIGIAPPKDYMLDTQDIVCKGDTAYMEIITDSWKKIEWIYDKTDEIVSTNASHATTQPGKYNVHVEFDNACPINDQVIVSQPDPFSVYPLILEQPYCQEICDGKIGIKVLNGNAVSLTWSFYNDQDNQHEIINQTVENLCEGRYYIKGINHKGCEATTVADLQYKHDECIQIPNAFSPNGDGYNDYWYMPQLKLLFPNVFVEVYDRWGRLMFQSTKGYPKPWDGTYRGELLPVDTYHYIIYLQGERNDKIRTGQVVLYYD